MNSLILVLGGGITKEGTLPDNTISRLDRCVDLYSKSPNFSVLLSGRWSYMLDYVPEKTEAKLMFEYLLENGIESKNTILEEESMDTIGNAFFTYKHFYTNDWDNIYIVTSNFHVERTKYIFDKVHLKIKNKILYESVDEDYSKEEYEVRRSKEVKIIKFMKYWMDSITNYDQLKELIYKVHPAYAKNPLVTREEVIKFLS